MKLTAMTGETVVKNNSENYRIITILFVNGDKTIPLQSRKGEEPGWNISEYDIPSGSKVKFVSKKVGVMPNYMAKNDNNIEIEFTADDNKMVDFVGHSKYGRNHYGYLISSEIIAGLPILHNCNSAPKRTFD